MIKFKVEITKIEEFDTVEDKWQRIREVPEDLKRKPGFYNDDEKEIKEFAYVETKVHKAESKVIYCQYVEQVNLTNVIIAVNGMESSHQGTKP